MNPLKIKAVSALYEDDKAVYITWEDGRKATVRLATVIARHQGMVTLLQQDIFESVRVGEWGWSIQWGENIDMGTERLCELANEQQLEYKKTLHSWRKRHHFTYDKAAMMLGISRRSIGLYENGMQPVPKHIALACKGWEAEHQ